MTNEPGLSVSVTQHLPQCCWVTRANNSPVSSLSMAPSISRQTLRGKPGTVPALLDSGVSYRCYVTWKHEEWQYKQHSDDWVMSHLMPVCPSARHFKQETLRNSGPRGSKQHGRKCWRIQREKTFFKNTNALIINLYLGPMRPLGQQRLTFLAAISTCLVDRQRSNPFFSTTTFPIIFMLFNTLSYFNTDWSLD